MACAAQTAMIRWKEILIYRIFRLHKYTEWVVKPICHLFMCQLSCKIWLYHTHCTDLLKDKVNIVWRAYTHMICALPCCTLFWCVDVVLIAFIWSKLIKGDQEIKPSQKNTQLRFGNKNPHEICLIPTYDTYDVTGCGPIGLYDQIWNQSWYFSFDLSCYFSSLYLIFVFSLSLFTLVDAHVWAAGAMI